MDIDLPDGIRWGDFWEITLKPILKEELSRWWHSFLFRKYDPNGYVLYRKKSFSIERQKVYFGDGEYKKIKSIAIYIGFYERQFSVILMRFPSWWLA